ncbi:hypothetical protein MKX03_024359 [Papaver bracteatum]|nr:hypothetical protein MKX03_024359 [Papaver bracteatum]
MIIDNIFRFFQEGSEVSSLLGRIPSVVGYQPTLSTYMGTFYERITSTKEGSITSIQAIYVLVDNLTDPFPATIIAHLDATTVLSRGLASKGIYPGVYPLNSTSNMLQPRIVEIALSTNSGQIGVLPNHAPIVTVVDIGILKLRLNDCQWLKIDPMSGFTIICNCDITILVNDADKGTLKIAEATLSRVEGKRQTIEDNLVVRRSRTRLHAINAIS